MQTLRRGVETNQTHKRRQKITIKVFELMQTDLCGPVCPVGLNGEQQMQLLTDDFSGAMWLSCLRRKAKQPMQQKKLYYTHKK